MVAMYCRNICCFKENLGKFVQYILPGVLEEMQEEHGWNNLPRTVVHDKASYMVSPSSQRLNVTFANSMKKCGFRRWVGDIGDPADWMCGTFGDVYLHETMISHIRRLLDKDFASTQLSEPFLASSP